MIARKFTSALPRDSRYCEFIHKRDLSQRVGFASNERASSSLRACYRGGDELERVFFGPR
jgi:hypothetical protein